MKTMLMLIFVCIATEASEFESRIETLKFHLDRLGAIAVTEDLHGEKKARLDSLAEAIQEGASDEVSFDRLYLKMDEAREWFLTHAANQPRLSDGSFEETEELWILSNSHLKATWSRDDFAIRFETEGAVWDFVPCGTADFRIDETDVSLLDATQIEVKELRNGYSTGMLATLSGFSKAEDVKLFLGLYLNGAEALFEISATEDEEKIESLDWPKAIRIHEDEEETYTVLPYMQGALIASDWEGEFVREDGRPFQTRYFYMPWWGHLQDGHGVQAISETPYDGGARIHHPAGGPTRISPLWYSSLGGLRYSRRVRYVFDEEATYVSMAKRYRRYAKETGLFVSLREKRIRNPEVDEVIGKPVIHTGALYHFVPKSSYYNKERIEENHNLTTFDQIGERLSGLKKRGLEDAYVHLDGWGYRGYDSAHPDSVPVGEEQGGWAGLSNLSRTCKNLGYLFAIHDNYRDFYWNAVSFDERFALRKEDGSIPQSSTWCGGDQSLLSARFAPEYVRGNHDRFAEHGVELGGAYLDVFAVADLDESFQEAHPMSREECAQFRLESFHLLGARGYVVSSEEPVDYALPAISLVHHGPYPSQDAPRNGNPIGIPIPLFNLVYHDAVLLPWNLSENGGGGIPEGESGRLHCALNAGLPYVSLGASEEEVQKVQEIAALARRLAFEEMINHEFVDDSKRKQRTTYSDGTQVTVDFESGEYWVE